MLSQKKGSPSTMALNCSQAKLWVKTHYERHGDGVVAKAIMFKHYEEHCRQLGRNTMETSIFGRVVKSVFPDVTIRRLGGRDNLKYYYCGIHAKDSSPFAMDNTTTTRPKRRLRKRELLLEKSDVNNCLLWLHANYVAGHDGCVMRCEVYDKYVLHCATMNREALSVQYFGMIVSHAFPSITKRKLGPRANQQKYYNGIQDRMTPLNLETVVVEFQNTLDSVFCNGRLCCREDSESAAVDEFDDSTSCRSPASDTSESSTKEFLSASFSATFDGRQRDYSDVDLHEVSNDVAAHLKEEPLDFDSKEEPLDFDVKEEQLDVDAYEEEPLDLHVPNNTRSCSFVELNHLTNSLNTNHLESSMQNDTFDSKPTKIYKPRFHIDYNTIGSWDSDNDDQPDQNEYCNSSAQSVLESFLLDWLQQSIEECDDGIIIRDHLYSLYEQVCEASDTTPLPVTYFERILINQYPSVLETTSDGKHCYHGIKLHIHMGEIPLYQQIETELRSYGSSPGQTLYMDALQPGGEFELVAEMPLRSDLHDGKYYLKSWLNDNFEPVTDSCVLKLDAYRHYEFYMKSLDQSPFEMNVFGKIVRQVFPQVTIRRLGGRVRPQYHYCGIAVKISSPLCNVMSGKDPAQRSRKKEIAADNHSAEVVIEWLRETYDMAKEQIITKSEVYANYSSYCIQIGETPVSVNYFGKLVKHCFPYVEVRKFGGRNEPTWYYFGLVPRSLLSGTGDTGANDVSDFGHRTTKERNNHLSPSVNQFRPSSPIPIVLSQKIHDMKLSTPPNQIVKLASHRVAKPVVNSTGRLCHSLPLNVSRCYSGQHFTNYQIGSFDRDNLDETPSKYSRYEHSFPTYETHDLPEEDLFSHSPSEGNGTSSSADFAAYSSSPSSLSHSSYTTCHSFQSSGSVANSGSLSYDKYFSPSNGVSKHVPISVPDRHLRQQLPNSQRTGLHHNPKYSTESSESQEPFSM